MVIWLHLQKLLVGPSDISPRDCEKLSKLNNEGLQNEIAPF